MIQLPNEEYIEEDGVTHCTMLQVVKHTIGMDTRNCYTRHGKKFYRPYRNFFITSKREKEWDELVSEGLAGYRELVAEDIDGYHEYVYGVIYWLTRKGLDWLGNHIGVTIHNER